MTVELNDILKVTVEGLGLSGQDVQNSYHIENRANAIADADAIDDLVEVLEALYQLLTAVLSVGLIIRDIRALNVTQTLDLGLGLFVDDTPGANAQTVMPPQNAMGISLATARLGVRGRKSFGLLGDDQADDEGVVLAASILDMADVGDYMTDIVVATNSSWSFGVLASADDAWLRFNSYTIPTTIVTQRRRRRGVGS